MGERIMAAGRNCKRVFTGVSAEGGGLKVSSIYTTVTRERALPWRWEYLHWVM